jgi:hypothetical protein
MHSWLVDTVLRPVRGGILRTILQDYLEAPALSHVRLLMYTTDTWFADNRLYTILMMGCMTVAVRNNTLDTGILCDLLTKTHALAVKALVHMAERALERFKNAQYRVLSHMLRFDSISVILRRQYQRNDGHVDETSLRFHSSYWMNILGYYVRLTNSIECLDDEINRHVHDFLSNVLEIFHAQRPDLELTKLEKDIALPRRLVACFDIFSTGWNLYMRSICPETPPTTQGEPPAKRQRTE